MFQGGDLTKDVSRRVSDSCPKPSSDDLNEPCVDKYNLHRTEEKHKPGQTKITDEKEEMDFGKTRIKRRNDGEKEKNIRLNRKDKEIYQNLNKGEQAGLDSLLTRVDKNEIRITPTDKSGRFAILTVDQYI